MGFRITSWNVNGIRNPFGHQPWRENRTFQAMFDTLEADIVVLQETKIQRKDLTDDMVLVPGWDVFFSLPKHKKGYSGVAIYTRSARCCPIRAEEGITGVLCPPGSSVAFRHLPPDQQIGGYPAPDQLPGAPDPATLDSEGRCVILEFPAFVLIGVYGPAVRDDETRTEFRSAFLDALDARVRNLVALGKNLVLCGDLNVVRSGLDTAGLQERLKKENMTVRDFLSSPPRRLLNQLVFGGDVFGGGGPRDEGRAEPVLWDLCREFHPARQGMYTCWETKRNARPGNFGSRIDYVLCSARMRHWFVAADIQEGLMGSDHCPVYAVLGDTVEMGAGKQVAIADLLNPAGTPPPTAARDLLPLSAKRIPEFDRRQSIRDMFSQKAAAAAVTKRPHEPARPPSRPPATKKIRTEEGAPRSGPGRSQSSLAGFFKPTTATFAESNNAGTQVLDTVDVVVQDSIAIHSGRSSADDAAALDDSPSSPGGTSLDVSVDSPVRRPAHDSPSSATTEAGMPVCSGAAQSKASWARLLAKRPAPKCEHGEDCLSLVTKKPGINCGRSFYICARPLGPTGLKEQGTEFRCGTFIWSSDWNGRQARATSDDSGGPTIDSMR